MTQAAPLYEQAARGPDGVGPEGGEAVFVTTPDGARLRLAHWPAMGPATGAARGTVLIFNGRSEYIEKFGPVAARLVAAGWHVATLDWRGQGLSSRHHPEPLRGHVAEFAEYQADVAALMGFVQARGLPQPLHLLSHSMGGCIGLRALHDGLPVASAAFSAPMWGIRAFPLPQGMAARLATSLHGRGQGAMLTPTTTRAGYVLQAAFRWNMLTRDPEMWHWMRQHLTAHPDLNLGGPSITWLDAAFREMTDLARRPSPNLPALVAMGTRERIVCKQAIRRRMAEWPGGKLEIHAGAEHEILMERPVHRDRFTAATLALFGRQS
ncbi:MAG: alpha/beta hydrolase [Gemmobacter sp.]|uniref:alpha/beta fold hydrolase n=1 Tax=Gemmobacter sp. TaxID=1898957 RepID=UPI001A51CBE0|nr:alpha/beta hydrolase [Gemmobacter sp.]MBL8561217.1 alpha/beta hydrolase [Gemmobacter sp.]